MKNISYQGKRVAILGYGLEGQDLLNFLLPRNAFITIYDKKSTDELEIKEKFKKRVKIVVGSEYLKGGLKNYDIIFRSPGFYRYLPEIVEAEKEGVLVSSSTKLFISLCKGKVIGITGTKGKGTTATLIYKILKKAKKDVYLAGNIGKPMLELLPKIKKRSWVVLELSSFQLIDMQLSPNISVVLNITEDHMDWHKNRREYVESKTNIVKHQHKSDMAIINIDYPTSKSFAKLTDAKVYYFSVKKSVKGAFVENQKIYINMGRRNLIGGTEKLMLRGKHNWENVCAAICASYLAGATIDSIKSTVFSFKGLEHRLEFVREIDNISFYNDSFSTNPQTTIAAINSFKEPITLVLGGFDKKLDYGKMAKEIKKAGVANAILIGDIAARLEKDLANVKYDGNIINMGYSSMKKIVKICFKVSSKKAVVILSPATSSFDMFENYKERGNQFKKAVNNLVKTS